MRRFSLGRTLVGLGVLMLLGAAGLYGYNACLDMQAGDASVHTAQVLVEEIQQNMETQPETREPEAEPEIPLLILDGKEYLGLLTIPELELSLPVQADWSYPKLKESPCLYRGGLQEGQMFIAAHNFVRHFGYLGKLSQGDTVLFTDGAGNQYRYRVEEQEVIDGNDVEGMLDTDYDLSLFTCVYNGTRRLTLRCNRI